MSTCNWLDLQIQESQPVLPENLPDHCRQLVTDEPVEFEKLPVEVQDCRKITDHYRGI